MSDTLASIGEFGLIDRINRLLQREGVSCHGLTLGIGDDTASFSPRAGYELLVTCDAMVEGRHYLPEYITPGDLGRRAMALNISDIGAMGGLPLYALVSLGLRGDTKVWDVEALYRGFLEELNPFGAGVVGGNLTKSGDAQFIDITLIGEVEPEIKVTRSGAKPGDAILVTGYPGQAAAGLQILLRGEPPADPDANPLVRAYLAPGHRAREGNSIARSMQANSMIDTSDGFLGDLGHICEGSGVGAELVQDRFSVSDALRRAARDLGQEPYELFLGDSDDYELIVTTPPQGVAHIRNAVASQGPVPVTEVGRITDQAGRITLIRADGSQKDLTPKGWDHFRI